jgi:DivIVA domain-containing protein
MPDQHIASQEHAIMREVIEPLATLPSDPVSVAADIDFPTVLRGYDRAEVDAYVRRTSQLVAELQATRSPEAAVRRALERVGEQIAGILQRAHETAEQITAQSRVEAEERLEAARREAHQITVGAAQQAKALDAETDRIWAERHRILADVQELADKLTALVEPALERFPAEESVTEHPVANGADDGARPEGAGAAGGAGATGGGGGAKREDRADDGEPTAVFDFAEVAASDEPAAGGDAPTVAKPAEAATAPLPANGVRESPPKGVREPLAEGVREPPAKGRREPGGAAAPVEGSGSSQAGDG